MEIYELIDNWMDQTGGRQEKFLQAQADDTIGSSKTYAGLD